MPPSSNGCYLHAECGILHSSLMPRCIEPHPVHATLTSAGNSHRERRSKERRRPMLKQIGFVGLSLSVLVASGSAFAQQPERPSKPAVSGKATAKPATTRAIVVQESDEKPAATP